MPLKIYGTSASRAARPLWVAQELGLEYEHIPLPYLGGATRTPEFLRLNPNGRIPVVDDNGVQVWESMACALYPGRCVCGVRDGVGARRQCGDGAEPARVRVAAVLPGAARLSGGSVYDKKRVKPSTSGDR